MRIDWIILCIALLIGFIVKPGGKPYIRTLPYFLLLTLLTELVGRYYRLRSINNVLLFNCYTTAQLTYFGYCFYNILKQQYIKRIILLIPIVCVFNIVLLQGPKTFHTYSYGLIVPVLLAIAASYFYAVFKKAEIEYLWKEPDFWFITGTILFLATSVSIIGILNYMASLPKTTIYLLREILLAVNGLFYLMILMTLLCKPTIRKFTYRY